jgi:NAD(P)-dependent dehydrogenase (short-subunit alcohol dehydrogenase family)
VEHDPRVVVVSGGASGLGRAVAAALGGRGDIPVVLDVQPPDGPWPYEEVDLSSSKEAEQSVRRTAEQFGRIDAVVTCAGIDRPGPLATTSTEDWEAVIAVNLLGTVAVVRAALPWLERENGKVVTVSSTLGHRAVSDATAYCASKFGIVGFTRALTAEMAGRVGVTLLTPGGMATSFFDEREEKYRPGADTVLCAPEHVAAAVLTALDQPPGCEVRELVVMGPTEGSWP